MNKKFLTFGILTFVLVGILIPHIAFGETIDECGAKLWQWNPLNNTCVPPTTAGLSQMYGSALDAVFGSVASGLFYGVGTFLISFSSLALSISGSIFDFVIDKTIVNSTIMLGNQAASGAEQSITMGESITAAWSTLRDISNIAFIFVLLYAAFKTMFDASFGNFQTTIKNIIIDALLINFSLFFSKVVIDASNVVSLGFFKSIASSSYELGSSKFTGISAGYMRMLGLQTFFDANILTGTGGATKVLTLGVGSSVFMLITAVIFLIAAIMFATRFILLVMLMILSPLALIAYIIPGQEKYFSEWKNSLINQSFFAPLYFALTWVVFKLGNSLIPMASGSKWVDIFSKTPKDSMPLLLNYILIIGFSIAALVLSKRMASSTFGFKEISGGIGTAALGGVGFAGRQTFGRVATGLANNKKFQTWAATSKTGKVLESGTNKLAGASFDVRGIADTKVGKFVKADAVMGIAGKAGGVGGQRAVIDAKTEKRRKPIDATMRQFRDKPDVIAKNILTQRPEDQQYMYDKLSARDRAAVNDELDKLGATTTKDRLMKNMSLEEQEKTTKAGKEAGKEKNVTDAKKAIDDLIVGTTPLPILPGSKTATNPAGTPATFDNLISDLTGKKGLLPTSDTNKLSDTALKNPDVIRRLTPKHLADLTKNRDMDDDVRNAIISEITNPAPYPMQKIQEKYINSNTQTQAIWGI